MGSPAWRVFDQDGVLVATGGADEVLFLDDVPGEVAGELAACWGEAPPEPSSLSADARRAIAQLEPLGVFGPRLELSAAPVLGFAGDDVGLESMVADLLGWPTDGDVQFGVWVRAATRWQDAHIDAWLSAAVPHLVVDLAAAHTIAIGPLVIGGHTSCVACLAGRVASRWGDPELPARPAATDGPALHVAAGLIALQAQRAVAGDYPLANRTASLDLDSMLTTVSPVLRSASCPHCGGLEGDGRVRLPWA